MKLLDFTKTIKNKTDEESKDYAILFGDIFYSKLKKYQDINESNHKVSPTKLTNGRWMICADVLRESLVGTLYQNVFDTLINEEVEIVDIKTAISLIPVSEESPIP